jgi:hypothetical protein
MKGNSFIRLTAGVALCQFIFRYCWYIKVAWLMDEIKHASAP